VLSNLGAALVAVGQTQKGAEHLERAIAMPIVPVEAHYNLGLALSQLGETEKAIESFQRAIQLRPNYGHCRARLASVLAKAGRTNEAIAEFQESLRIDPDDVRSHHRLGVLFRTLGQWRDAVLALTDGLALDPQNAPIVRELALIHLEADDEALDPDRALELANRLVGIEREKNDKRWQESLLIHSLALAINQQSDEALRLLQDVPVTPETKSDIALIAAIAQHDLGLGEASEKNYKGAKSVLGGAPLSRLRNIALRIADEKLRQNPEN
jgi:tetratricopeptide (TPR) repeat protein